MTHHMEVFVNVDRRAAHDDMFIVRAGVTSYDSLYDKHGKYEEYIRISNHVNTEKLSVNMSTCFPSDFELAEKINECYTQAFARTKLEMSFNKYKEEK